MNPSSQPSNQSASSNQCSTASRNLQNEIRAEIDALYPQFSLKFPHISHVTITFFIGAHYPHLQVLYRLIIAHLHHYQPLYRAFRQSLLVQSWPTLPLCLPAVTHPLRNCLQTNPENSRAIFKNSNISLAMRK